MGVVNVKNDVEIVNLTPHEITLVREDGEVMKIPPSGQVARVKVEQEVVNEINGISIVRTKFGDIEGLPEPQDGKIFIVSSLVAQAAAKLGRTDVVAPDTSPQGVIRDENGRIVGVKRFQIF